jgi:hypothetical protein
MKKIQLYENGNFIGWVDHPTDRWWFDETCKSSFEYFDLDSFYNEDYFKEDHVGDIVVNNYVLYLLDYYTKLTGKNIKNVLEIGTGGGWFTKKFLDYELEVFGVEGAQCGYDSTLLKGVPESSMLKHDLREPLNLNKKFDVVCCTEVSEHIEMPFTGTLVKTLTDHSDFIWFSSSAPGLLNMPPHYHHCNEQPDKFWINLFDFFNYDYVKLSDEIYNNTQLRARYVFYNRNVYDLKNCDVNILGGFNKEEIVNMYDSGKITKNQLINLLR